MKSSKRRVMERREEGAPLPPPLPSQGSLYSQVKPHHVTGPQKPGRVPTLQPPSPAKTAARERVPWFSFFFLF